MKEATGELNLTLIVVILVAALSFFFFSVIWPAIRSNVRHSANCDEAICASEPNSDGKTVTCYSKGDKNHSKPITCTWKG